MKNTFTLTAALAAAFSSLAFAQNSDHIPTCGDGSKCPEDAPCCSQYGQCGVGAYCLGGCDPMNSFNIQSCMPAPTCRSADFTMDSLDGMQSQSRYLGNASNINWVTSGTPRVYNDQAVLLTMPPDTVGTLLMSAHYVWYGKVSAKMTTSQGAGVITAFILMSDVKDEIDFEFVGSEPEVAETNFYFQGITNYENGKNIDMGSNTRLNEHEYTIDWQPDYVTWAIDGDIVRTLNRNETYNETSKQYHFPQTPSRVQLSLWPGGLPSNGEGTIEWAGGLVDWDDDNYMSNGYYFASVSDITVECYEPPQGFNKDFGDNAYYYTDLLGTNDTVAIGNNNTVLGSMQATGNDQDKGKPDDSSSSSSSSSASRTGTATSSSASSSRTPESVPGMSGGGNQGLDGEAPSSDDTNNNGGGGSGGDVGAGDLGSTGDSGTTDSNSDSNFNQGMDNAAQQDTSQASQVVAGSAVALVGFFVAALML